MSDHYVLDVLYFTIATMYIKYKCMNWGQICRNRSANTIFYKNQKIFKRIFNIFQVYQYFTLYR